MDYSDIYYSGEVAPIPLEGKSEYSDEFVLCTGEVFRFVNGVNDTTSSLVEPVGKTDKKFFEESKKKDRLLPGHATIYKVDEGYEWEY